MAFVTKSLNQQTGGETAPTVRETGAEEPVEQPGSDDAGDAAEGRSASDSGKDSTPLPGKPPVPPRGASSSASGPGFFGIYKKGQGYWTRMGTAIGIAVISAFTAYNLYYYVPTFLTQLSETNAARVGVAIGIITLLALVGSGFWLMNKPSNADFLIATDSEMKKVNWTSKRELIGSTKVVILFMFVVTLFLFTVDIVFGYLFHIARVLESGPFGS